MSNDYEYETELTAGREDIVAVLTGVLDGLTAGSIRLHDEAGTVTATVPDELELEVEFEVVDDEVSLELELAWSVPDGETAAVSLSDGHSDNRDDPAPPVDSPTDLQSLARFELFRDRGNEWRWRLRHRNGNIIATSGEGYTRKHNARKGLRSVIQNSPDAKLTEDAGN